MADPTIQGTGAAVSPEDVLAALPQQPPFRFVDEILELDDDHIVAAVRFDAEADFYRGHFPGRPVTPGVLLVEAMAQAGVVALGIRNVAARESLEAARSLLSVFTEADVEFRGAVAPGERVLVHGRKVYFRRGKFCAEVEMARENGEVVASGRLAGMGVAA